MLSEKDRPVGTKEVEMGVLLAVGRRCFVVCCRCCWCFVLVLLLFSFTFVSILLQKIMNFKKIMSTVITTCTSNRFASRVIYFCKEND